MAKQSLSGALKELMAKPPRANAQHLLCPHRQKQSSEGRYDRSCNSHDVLTLTFAHASFRSAVALREEEERTIALAELILQICERSTALAAARSAGAAPVQSAGRTTRSASAQVAAL